jgi:exopolysaccharide biosynthesis polyprenyl glycosylphosphotransferase
MQPNLEYGMPIGSPQTNSKAKHKILSKQEECSSQMAELAAESGIEDRENEEVITQEAETIRQLGARRWKKPSPTTWHLLLISGDVILLLTALLLILALVPFVHFTVQVRDPALSMRDSKFIWMCFALVSWFLAINITQSQDLSYVSSRFKSPFCTLFALVLMIILWIILSYIFIGIGFITSARVGLLFLALASPVFIAWRVLFAEIMHLPRYRRRAVIVGVNTAGELIAKELRNIKRPSANVLGYIDESVEERPYQDNLPILGGRAALRYLVYNNIIDMIIIALDYKVNPELFKEATEATQFGISVVPMSVVYESNSGRVPVEYVSDQWYVALHSEHIFSPLYLFWRKVLDLACGLCGLLVLCLVLPIISLLIYLDSPGPIFYSQERLGCHRKPFRIYKFRSMRTDAEDEGHAIWATEYDPRITRVGHFLRTTHLDELPQLLNILRGDMSLIGPRPERAAFITELEKTIPFYGYRLAVKPGLTGWAQVKYRYGRTDNDALIKLQYDLYYIKRQSFMLDIFIILKTVIEVLSLHGT